MRCFVMCATLCLLMLLSGCGGGSGSSVAGASAPLTVPDNVILVDATARGANDGSSWVNAFTDINAALAASSASLNEIWVAAGTYYPAADLARNASIQLVADVAVYGGFIGIETALSARDVTAHKTILSGDLGVAADTNDNVYHVVTGADGARLDGFTVSGGNANSTGSNGYGGGLYVNASSMQVWHCTFTENYAEWGGGALTQGAATESIFVNCVFIDNSAHLGAGLFNYNSATVAVLNCLFTENHANYAGSIFSYNLSETNVINCTMSKNNAVSDAASIYNTTSTVNVSNTIVWGNFDNGSPVANFSEEFVGTINLVNCIAFGIGASDGNLNADPLFKDTASNDFSLLKSSPAINAADKTIALGVDLNANNADGNTLNSDLTQDKNAEDRVIHDEIDMGAYEYADIPINVLAVDAAVVGGDNDGSSWANAFSDLQDAIAASNATLNEIWVAQGTYYPTAGTDRTQTFQLKASVGVYGGFDATEIMRTERDIVNNESILSGDIGVKNDRTDNVYHVVSCASASTLDGMRVTLGYADSVTNFNQYGAGLIADGVSATIKHCYFYDNRSAWGGAVFFVNGGSDSLFIDCVVSSNIATSGGGGVYVRSGANPLIVNSLIINNEAQGGGTGGGIRAAGSDLNIINCTIVGNVAATSGAGIFGYETVNVDNSIVWDNSVGALPASFANEVYGLPATINNSLVYGITETNGNINIDPQFINRGKDDYALKRDSLAIDAGNNAVALGRDLDGDNGDGNTLLSDLMTDLGGYERIVNGPNRAVHADVVDMGAFEHQSPGIAPPLLAPVANN